MTSTGMHFKMLALLHKSPKTEADSMRRLCRRVCLIAREQLWAQRLGAARSCGAAGVMACGGVRVRTLVMRRGTAIPATLHDADVQESQ